MTSSTIASRTSAALSCACAGDQMTPEASLAELAVSRGYCRPALCDEALRLGRMLATLAPGPWVLGGHSNGGLQAAVEAERQA